MSDDPRPPNVTIKHAAWMLGVSVPTVRRAVRSRALQSFRVGRAIRIPRVAVIAFARARLLRT